MVKALERNPAANAVVCDILRVDSEDRPRSVWLNLLADYYLKKNELFRVAFGGIPCLIRRDVFLAAGLHEESLRASSDRDIGVKMVKHINIVGVPERLYMYREHGGNITSNSRAYKRSPEYREHFRRLAARYFAPEDYLNDWAEVRRFQDLAADYAVERRRKYANTILRCALQLAVLGRKKEALAELPKAAFLAPEVNYSAFAALLRLGFRDLRNFWVNMNCWFKYAYDDYFLVDVC
ncbi:putative glycosyl transferase [Candidatus Termititenax persephonae]|uniref:Glycosyl transferase n=1 Tax=Candidatus Termititenax persephonae TaxID=2218525 RepID=A0A388TKL1_9BACT|nr:putative glycosyl transferase [Candidatus Termititenax persephonae]